MATSCFSWQSGFLSCTSTGFVSQRSCAVSTAHTHHSHSLHAYKSPGQSVTHHVSSTGWASKHGMCMSTHPKAMLALLSDPMNGAPRWITVWTITLCHSLGFQKCHLQRKRKLWCTKVHISQRKDCLTEIDSTLNHYYFCYSSLKANSKVLTTWIRLITATEKFLEGLYFIFNLLIWSHIYLCDKAAVGGRGKS